MKTLHGLSLISTPQMKREPSHGVKENSQVLTLITIGNYLLCTEGIPLHVCKHYITNTHRG